MIERSFARVSALNVAAVIAGIATAILANLAMMWFFGFLLNFPVVVSILSFPTTPELYVSSGINFACIGAGYYATELVAPPTKNGRKPAVSLVALYMLYCFATTAYNIFITQGFRDTFIVNVLSAIFSFLLAVSGFTKAVIPESKQKDVPQEKNTQEQIQSQFIETSKRNSGTPLTLREVIPVKLMYETDQNKRDQIVAEWCKGQIDPYTGNPIICEKDWNDYVNAYRADEQQCQKVRIQQAARSPSVESTEPEKQSEMQKTPKFCRKCGNQLRRDSEFCEYCGTPVK